MGNEEEKRRKEIEQKKKILKDEFGMQQFMSSGDLPPELQSQWLDSVMAFEKQAANPETITVFERLGRPKFIKTKDLDDEQLSKELDRIVELLAINSFVVDTIRKVENRVFYQFITEELFEFEIDDIRVAGMMSHYIYEEFYPNHEYDIKEHSEEVIDFLFSSEHDFTYVSSLELSQFVTHNGESIGEGQVKKIITSFQESFTSFELQSLTFETITFDVEQEKGKAEFSITYFAHAEDGKEAITFSGKGCFDLLYSYEYWAVIGINMPGLKI